MMSYFYASPSNTADRDLSRAASERYLMLQALSERQSGTTKSAAGHRLFSRVRHQLQSWRATGGRSSNATGQAEQVLTCG